jgi:hypothetical protein
MQQTDETLFDDCQSLAELVIAFATVNGADGIEATKEFLAANKDSRPRLLRAAADLDHVGMSELAGLCRVFAKKAPPGPPTFESRRRAHLRRMARREREAAKRSAPRDTKWVSRESIARF